MDFVKDLSLEEQRAVAENLSNQETLAIFDLLCEGKQLEPRHQSCQKSCRRNTYQPKSQKAKL